MRNFLSLVAAGVLVAAGSAHAAPADFTTTLTLTVGSFAPVSFTGAGTGDSVGGGSASLPEDAIIAGFVSRLTTPLVGVLTGFAVCEQGLAVIPDPTPATFPIPPNPGDQVLDCAPLGNGGSGPLTYDAGTGTAALIATAYLTNASNQALVQIPLEVVGVGGTSSFSVLGSPSTLTGNPWTIDHVTVTGGLATDPAPTTFEDTGHDNRDGSGNGELKLVTTALANLGALGTVPSIASLTTVFTAPEPGATAIGAAAFGTLALLSRRARRS